jgi:hypothetical protein
MISDQLRPDAGIEPSSRSLACPANDTESPTAYVNVDTGESIAGTGG